MFPVTLHQPIEFAFILLKFLPHLSPLLQDSLRGPQGQQVATLLVRKAYTLTQQSSFDSAVSILEESPFLQNQFQQEILKALFQPHDLLEKKYLPPSDSKKILMMILVAVLGLMVCLGSLTYFRSHLPGEAVGILSTIVGIFGSCLKDVYRFELNSR